MTLWLRSIVQCQGCGGLRILGRACRNCRDITGTFAVFVRDASTALRLIADEVGLRADDYYGLVSAVVGREGSALREREAIGHLDVLRVEVLQARRYARNALPDGTLRDDATLLELVREVCIRYHRCDGSDAR